MTEKPESSKPNTITKTKRLTPTDLRDIEMVKEMLLNPDKPAYQAYMKTRKTTNAHAARVETARVLAKPSVQAMLSEFDVESQATIVEMMNQRDDKRLAFDAAKDIQDRVYGKAKQSVEVNSTSISLSIDLSGQSQPILDVPAEKTDS